MLASEAGQTIGILRDANVSILPGQLQLAAACFSEDADATDCVCVVVQAPRLTSGFNGEDSGEEVGRPFSGPPHSRPEGPHYLESGSGLTWNFTSLLVFPLPPSAWNGARVA